MRKVLFVLALVCSQVGRASAQCCGDCNGDGRVTIDELVTAVNKALGSCADATATTQPTATPTPPPTATPPPANRCPFTFSDNGNLCTFHGSFNRGCGNELDSLLSVNGALVVVSIDTMLDTTPVLEFAAQVDNPTSANLMAWSTDGFNTVHVTAGVIQLTDNGGTLIIFPNDPPLQILSCNFVQYTGAYTASARSRARAVADTEPAAAFDRLHDWLARPLPDIAD